MNPASFGYLLYGGIVPAIFGSGIGYMLANAIVGQVSGGHFNSAVSLSLALFGKVQWTKLPVYLGGQALGAFIGTTLVYSIYVDSIKEVDVEEPFVAPKIFTSNPEHEFHGYVAAICSYRILLFKKPFVSASLL